MVLNDGRIRISDVVQTWNKWHSLVGNISLRDNRDHLHRRYINTVTVYMALPKFKNESIAIFFILVYFVVTGKCDCFTCVTDCMDSLGCKAGEFLAGNASTWGCFICPSGH